MPPGETGRLRGPMGPWTFPTSSQLRESWPWRYVGCQATTNWEEMEKEDERKRRRRM